VLLPGTGELLAAHRAALPQRDDLCGAFCGALALHAAGIERHGSDRIDQDTVALAAGSVVSAVPDPGHLPLGERGRRDYRLQPPSIADGAISGTTPAGLVSAIAAVSDGQLTAIPYSEPWTAETVAGLFDLAAGLARPVTLVANLATRQLWGSRVRTEQLLGYLLHGTEPAARADWDVGHFVCVIGRISGPGGSLYGVADTYPSLGSGGLHAQPAERLVLSLQRPDMPAGGMIVIVCSEDAAAVRGGAAELELVEGLWDNGSVARETPA
jgi:hypothetical protein